MAEALPKPAAPFPGRAHRMPDLHFARRSTAFVLGKRRREAKTRHIEQCELATFDIEDVVISDQSLTSSTSLSAKSRSRP